MKLAVLGAGVQARAILDDFLRFSGAERIGVADVDEGRLRALSSVALDPRVQTQILDVSDTQAVSQWLAPYDAAVSAVPYRFNAGLARAAIAARTHFTDLGGNNDIVDQELSLDEAAKQAGVTVIPDLGLAPGLVALLGADLVRRLDPPRALHLRVGGLPVHPEPPLGYRLFFSVTGLINEYIEPCRVIRGGRAAIVPGLSELERLQFPEPFGTLEAFQTSGGTSTLTKSLLGEVEELDYKTIRYPGHHDQLVLLQELGLFSSEAVELGEHRVVPRALTEALFVRSLGEPVADVVLLRVTASGRRNGQPCTLTEQLIAYGDEARGLSAMARCTGYPAAIITTLLARGEAGRPGALPQEACLNADRVRHELALRGLSLTLTAG